LGDNQTEAKESTPKADCATPLPDRQRDDGAVLKLGFSLVVAQTQGPDRALDFLTGYLIEYSAQR